MSIDYYDDALVAKFSRWLPEQVDLRVLDKDDVKRFLSLEAEKTDDKPLKLPMLSLSMDPTIELLSTTKHSKSFNGIKLQKNPTLQELMSQAKYTNKKPSDLAPEGTYQLNAIPIKLQYQMDIYTKTAAEGFEYVRALLFKIMNNPQIKIEIPYNDSKLEHVAYIKLQSTVSDTSAISERLFPGQFTRWTLTFELQDAFFFNIPYRKNWKLIMDGICMSFKQHEDTDICEELII